MAKRKTESSSLPIAPKRKPIVIRVCKMRAAFHRKNRTKGNACHTMEMTVPAEVARMVGVRIGDTMLVEGYADGFYVRKGGDLMSSDDERI